MEKKFVKVPFELELAKKITSGEVEGGIVTRKGYPVRILTFDMANRYYPICAKVLISVDEDCYHFAANGAHYKDFNPKSDVDLMMEIPEYMTFKDGDIVRAYDSIVIIKEPCVKNDGEFSFKNYASYNLRLNIIEDVYNFCDVKYVRYANETEKNVIRMAMIESGNPKYEAYSKRFFNIKENTEHSNSLNIGKEYEFKPFDKVLVRDDIKEIWVADIFSNYNKDSVYAYTMLGNNSWKYCIPYNEQTERLIGTSENPESVIPPTDTERM